MKFGIFVDYLKIQKADVLGFSMGSFIAQELAFLHPDKVNKLVLYGASCGRKENIPQSPEVAKILSNFVNHRSQDVEKVLSVIFPLSWIKSHPDMVGILQSKEIVHANTLKQQYNIIQNWFSTD